MARAGVRDAVVVGHSMAGVVIPKVAELAPARVGHLVFVAAVVLPHGTSIGEAHMASAAREVALGLSRSGGVNGYMYPADGACARWYNDLPPGDPRVTAALTRLTPQPLRPWLERIDLTRFYAMDVPRTYVRCLRDVAVPAARGLLYAGRLGVVPVDLDCAHSPMLSAVEALVEILDRV
jgi:pimeloyl-ACP methyl ester carboxylesterase